MRERRLAILGIHAGARDDVDLRPGHPARRACNSPTATIAWGAARDNWDVRYAPGTGQVVLATPIGGGTTDVRFMTYASGTITTNVHTTPAADCTNGLGFLDNTGGTNVYLGGADAAGGVRGFEISNAGTLTFTFPIDTANTDFVGNITGYAQPGGISATYVVVAYSVLQDNTAFVSKAALNNQTRVFFCDRTPTTIPIQTVRSLALASRAFTDGQGNYFAVAYYQSLASSIFADSTPNTAVPSYFVLYLPNSVTSSSNIVGQFDLGFASDLPTSRNSADFYPWHLSISHRRPSMVTARFTSCCRTSVSSRSRRDSSRRSRASTITSCRRAPGARRDHG